MSFIPSGPRAVIVTCFVFVFVALAFPVAQQPPPKFSAAVEAVVLDVSVLDKDRRPVRGLKATDFTVLEDGEPQKVTSFDAFDFEDSVPTVAPAPWVREVAPDVQKNTDVTDKRLVVIVMDDAAPMPAPDVLHARPLARDFVNALGPDDLAAVVYARNKRAGQEFTRDRSRLLAAIERFNGAPDRGVAMSRAINAVPGRGFFDTFNEADVGNYFSVVRTLRGVVDSMAAIPGRRKAVAFVSTGIPLDDGFGKVVTGASAVEIMYELNQAFIAAQRANVNICALDPGGLRAPYNMAIGTGDPGNPGFYNREFLKTVAENTGGLAVVDTNDAMPGIKQALLENASYYLLGYVPSNARSEGRFRKIEVRVSNPGVTVRTRRGYFEPRTAKPGPKTAPTLQPTPLADALAGVVPLVDIPLHMNAASFARADNNQADVAIVVDATEALPPGSLATTDEIDVLVHAYDMQAQLRASDRIKVRLTFRGGMGESPHYGVLSRLALDPGRYQLRLAAHSSVLGKSGSVYADVEVPDFSKPALSLSGVMLDVTPPVLSAPKGKLSAILPTVPTAQREFTAGEQVGAFLRVYQGGKGPLAPVVVTTQVVDGRNTGVFSKTDTLGQDRFGPARAADYRVELPLMNLAKGPYLVSITATRGTLTAKREVRISVR